MKKMNGIRKWLALAVCAMMVTGLVPGLVPEAKAAVTGSGTAADPWVVDTWSDLVDKLQNGGSIRLGADVTYGQGGGVFAYATLTVESGATVDLDLNGHTIDRAGSAENPGRVIFVRGSGAKLTLSGNGTITGGFVNNAGSAGGLRVTEGGELMMKGGTISGNKGSWGGGVYVKNSTFTMTGGAISGNTGLDGGGVYVENSTFTMTGGEISGNTGLDGSGVYFYNGTFQVSGSPVIAGNKGDSGISNVFICGTNTISITGKLNHDAAIGVTFLSPNAAFTTGFKANNSGADPSDYFFSDNLYFRVASDDKGEAKLASDGHHQHNGKEWTGTNSLPIFEGYYYLTEDVTISESWTPPYGVHLCLNGHSITKDTPDDDDLESGVITVKDTMDLYDCRHAGCITHTQDIWGRGVYIEHGGTFTMHGGIICNNQCIDAGAGVYNEYGGTFTMHGGIICNNQCSDSGAGVYNSGTFTMSGGKICNNQSTFYDGGGGVFNAGGQFTLSGGEISGNEAVDGGGVRDTGTNSFMMSGGKIINNTAKNGGGGIEVLKSCTLSGGEISGNTAGELGGGVLVNAYARINLSGAPVVRNNTAGGQADNVFLMKNNNTARINVNGELKVPSPIGVTMKEYQGASGTYTDFTGVFTDGYSSANAGKDPADYFSSDNPAYLVGLSAGEAMLGTSKVASPTFSPAAGTYDEQQNVSLSCGTEGAAIYYTTDGKDPTAGSTKYDSTKPIPVTRSMTVKAIAVREGMFDSEMASAEYVITGYTLVYDANGGTGDMDSETVKAGQKYIFPDCGFTAPKDKAFDHWKMSGADGMYWPGESITIADNCAMEGTVTVTAYWRTGSVVYTVTEGGGSEYTPKSGETVTYKITRTPGNEQAYEKYQSTEVDGKPVSGDDLIVKSGSLILTMKSAYLDTLGEGEHSVKVLFADGSAETTLRIKAAEPTPTPKPTATPRPLPKTGDTQELILWGGMVLLGILGISGVIAARHRKQKH